MSINSSSRRVVSFCEAVYGLGKTGFQGAKDLIEGTASLVSLMTEKHLLDPSYGRQTEIETEIKREGARLVGGALKIAPLVVVLAALKYLGSLPPHHQDVPKGD